jgi:hypothetical protein
MNIIEKSKLSEKIRRKMWIVASVGEIALLIGMVVAIVLYLKGSWSAGNAWLLYGFVTDWWAKKIGYAMARDKDAIDEEIEIYHQSHKMPL